MAACGLLHGGYFCALSQPGPTILGPVGVKCLARADSKCPASSRSGRVSPPSSLQNRLFCISSQAQLQTAAGAVWMSAQRPVLLFNKVIRTTQIPSTAYPGSLPTWSHLCPLNPMLSEGINVNGDEIKTLFPPVRVRWWWGLSSGSETHLCVCNLSLIPVAFQLLLLDTLTFSYRSHSYLLFFKGLA